MSTGYGLTTFKFVYKIVEATEPVNPYDHRTAVATIFSPPNSLTMDLVVDTNIQTYII